MHLGCIGIPVLRLLNYLTFFCQPCHVKDWEVLLHFKVHGTGDALYGDGFAFWYSRERMQDGKVEKLMFT